MDYWTNKSPHRWVPSVLLLFFWLLLVWQRHWLYLLWWLWWLKWYHSNHRNLSFPKIYDTFTFIFLLFFFFLVFHEVNPQSIECTAGEILLWRFRWHILLSCFPTQLKPNSSIICTQHAGSTTSSYYWSTVLENIQPHSLHISNTCFIPYRIGCSTLLLPNQTPFNKEQPGHYN